VASGGCAGPVLLRLGNPFVNRVALHRQGSDGVWAAVPEAEYPSASDGHRRMRYAMLPLRLEPQGTTRFLVEIGGPSAVMFMPSIVPASELHLSAIDRSLLGGVLAGGIVSLAIYCALLGLITRFRGLLAFSVSTIALAGFYAIAAGLVDPLILWLTASGQDAMVTTIRLNGALGLTAALFHWLFVRALLANPPGSGAGRKFGWGALGGWALLLVAIPFVESAVVPQLCIVAAGLAIVAMLVDAVRAVRKRHPIARVILAALSVFAIAALTHIGLYLGLLPWSSVLLQAIPTGTWIESLLLAAVVGTQVKDLRGQQQELAARTQELSLLSQIDPLTGLSNRRAYDSVVPVELDRCLRRGRTASLLVIDIDHFKQVNDSYGHGFGDSVIRMLAATIANSIRSTDYAFRYGGEEFVVLLPGLDRTMALEIAERVMREFTNCSPSAPDGTRPFFSVSIGLAQLRPGDDVQGLFGRADAAMYRAKQEGRCRTVVAEDLPRVAQSMPKVAARV
jgi:diguanylate cyclase (GGDEF)-like protein